MIPYGKQFLDEKDIREVVKVLRSPFLTTGPKIKEFEEKFAQYVGAKYAVAVSSGTAALHLACLAAGLKKDEEVITSPITFAASANCALYCGAKPVFVDIKEEEGLIDVNLIEEKITSKTRIIIPVHYSGLPCDLEKIKEISKKYNLVVIEDACHALGAKYKESTIGDCRYSDICCFSFHPVKHITTGEGGMITTNSKEIYEKMILLRSHGISKKPSDPQKEEGSWYQEMKTLGFNYRLTDFQSALGLAQLEKLDFFIEKRRALATQYNQAFEPLSGIEIIRETEGKFNSRHLYVIKLKRERDRQKLFDYLKNNQINCQVHYLPVYLHPYYRENGFKPGLCPKAEDFYQKIISLPIYFNLDFKDQEKVINKIKGFFT